jgi:hypothetical protein
LRDAKEDFKRDLANRAQVGSAMIARFECGAPSNPSRPALLKQAVEAAGVRATKDGSVLASK